MVVDWPRRAHSGKPGAAKPKELKAAKPAQARPAAETETSMRAGVIRTATVFALNPNVLYLQSIPMSEPFFWAAQMAMLYYSVTKNSAGAGIACLAGTLARYDAWFLIPALTLYFWIASPGERWRKAFVVGAIASLGPDSAAVSDQRLTYRARRLRPAAQALRPCRHGRGVGGRCPA